MQSELALTLVAVFVAVALLVGVGVWFATAQANPVRRRLREASAPQGQVLGTAPAVMLDAPDSTWQKAARFVPKSPQDMSRLRRRLANAGIHSPGAAVAYGAVEFLLPVGLGLTALAIWGATTNGLVLSACGAVVGYLLPGFGLDLFVNRRRKQIRQGLPDVLDLLVVCLEAGTSLDQAIVKASDDLAITYPALAQELRLLSTETKAGKPRIEAFGNFAKRTQVDDVRALVAMLTQTDRFGTSVSQALRTLAATMRTKRRQYAEEQANKLGVKLVFPLVFCLFPALFVVALGPAVIQFVRVFVPATTR